MIPHTWPALDSENDRLKRAGDMFRAGLPELKYIGLNGDLGSKTHLYSCRRQTSGELLVLKFTADATKQFLEDMDEQW
jgi:hypothetical protein